MSNNAKFNTDKLDTALYQDNCDWSFEKPSNKPYHTIYIFEKEDSYIECCETEKCKVCGGNTTSSLLGLFAVCENCDYNEEEERRNVCPKCEYEGHIIVSKKRAIELDEIEYGCAEEDLCIECEEQGFDCENCD
tara:strand:+ start:128 stop:529 length:402 start_codon:yes stop_codon:yes gene_type:complete